MSMLYQKYQEHEQQAETAARRKDFAAAAFHLEKAAGFAIELAKLSKDPIRDSYLRDAHEKMDLAESLRKRAGQRAGGAAAPPQPPQTPGKAGEKAMAAQPEAATASFLMTERPTLRLRDVVGMEDLKKRIDEAIIKPYQYPEKYKKAGLDSGGGILLYGPPGTGKTYISRALAGELDVPFFNVDSAQLVDKYIGETPKHIARLFAEVRRHAGAIVYIDEVTQLLGDNETNKKTGGIEQMFRETDGLMTTSKGFLLLMTTNYPWELPKPMLRQGRVRDAIYIGLPGPAARLALLEYHAAGRQLAPDVDLPRLADALEGYSAAEVAGLVRRAKERSLLREIQAKTEDEPVTRADLESARGEIRVASSAADIQRYKDWQRENFAG